MTPARPKCASAATSTARSRASLSTSCRNIRRSRPSTRTSTGSAWSGSTRSSSPRRRALRSSRCLRATHSKRSSRSRFCSSRATPRPSRRSRTFRRGTATSTVSKLLLQSCINSSSICPCSSRRRANCSTKLSTRSRSRSTIRPRQSRSCALRTSTSARIVRRCAVWSGSCSSCCSSSSSPCCKPGEGIRRGRSGRDVPPCRLGSSPRRGRCESCELHESTLII
mmetsp:Transcript_7762/g.24536  ORF Transcript_7762/g.24536 Transcript_7762/m.24536 type:complete len:224 (-) Transcript_7762:8-679(-)